MPFIDRSTKLRMRRIFRRRQKQVETATTAAGQQFDANVFGKLEKLLDVKRFVGGWIILIVLAILLTAVQTVGLSNYYLTKGPTPGGVYNEGLVGSYTNANPIYATGSVDSSVSRLLFAGLLKYDDQNQLIGDLATDYTVNDTGKVYTVNLKEGLLWHDGKPLTADDVVFTYKLIQNPDVGSPHFGSWQGIQVSATNPRTVQFTLPNALASFPHGLTNGIVPKHILANIPPAQLRSNSFNTTEPVGAGPFMWSAIQLGSSVDSGSATALIALKSFEHYSAGKPKLAGFIVHTYDTEEQLVAAYRKRSVMAAAGLTKIPTELKKDSSTHINTFSTTATTMVFFKMSDPMFADSNIRKALALSTDKHSILQQFEYGVMPAYGPLQIGQLGYDKAYKQVGFDIAAANAALEQAGWKLDQAGIRQKNGTPLYFSLLVEDIPDSIAVAKKLQKSWKAAGVDVRLITQPPADFRASVDRHDYTALLYSISIGPDPDVYVYWDSAEASIRSQSRLNLSEYKSTAADTALESGRTRQDPALRAIKYQAFQKAWQQDNPAIALFQPNSVYVTRGKVSGLTPHRINSDTDRYYSVHTWQINTGQIDK